MARKKDVKRTGPSLDSEEIEALVSEAIVDAYGDGEQRVGFFTKISDNLDLPFQTTVLGVLVTVKSIDMVGEDDIVALCVRGRERQRLPILELPLPTPRPLGWEWIEAYRHWANP